MGKPLLSQMISIMQKHKIFVTIEQKGERQVVKCSEAVDRYGNVEVEDIGCVTITDNAIKSSLGASTTTWVLFI